MRISKLARAAGIRGDGSAEKQRKYWRRME